MTSSSLPYPGLRPFEESDHWLFFGREAQVSGMLHHLEERRFVAVIGASGSGKSSLVRAGLVPAVRAGFLEDSEDWLIATIRPGRDPYLRLARELARAARSPGAPSAASAIASSAMTGKEDVGALTDVLANSDKALPLALDSLGWRGNTMVIVDQFEEIFAFRRDSPRSAEVVSRDVAAAFVAMLLNASAAPSNRIWVVLTMRSDFIGDCEAFLGLPEAISQSQFLVPRLDRRQMEEAIRRPGDACGGGMQRFGFQDELVTRLINDAGDRPDQLPLLQHVLMRMWKMASDDRATGTAAADAGAPLRLTLDHCKRTGGIHDALSRHADLAWQTIETDPVLAPIARKMFLLLCDVSPDGQITRRRPRVSQVMLVANATLQQVTDITQLFNSDDRNFIAFDGDFGPDTVIDLSHEALLRQWRLFRETWLAEERADVFELRLLAELSRAGVGGQLSSVHLERALVWRTRATRDWALRYVTAGEWDELQKFVDASVQARRRQRRFREAGIAAVSLSLLGVAVAGTYFGYMTNKSNRMLAISAAKVAQNAAIVQMSLDAAQKSEATARDALQRSVSAQAQAYAAVTAEAEAENEALRKSVALQGALYEAERAKSHASAEALWHPLMAGGDGASTERDNALLKVAQSPFDVRQRFIEDAWTDPTLAKRLINGADMLDATVGISPRMHDVLLSRLEARPIAANETSDAARAQRLSRVILSRTSGFDALLAEAVATDDAAQCTILTLRLSQAARRLPPGGMRPAVNRLLAGAGDAGRTPACDVYGPPLVALSNRIGAADALAVSLALLDTIPKAKGVTSPRTLDAALALVVRAIPAEQAPAYVGRALAALGAPGAKPTGVQLAAAKSLLPMAAGVRDADIQPTLDALVLVVVDGESAPSDKAVAAIGDLLPRLRPSEVAGFMQALMRARQAMPASFSSPALNRAMVATAHHLAPQDAAALAMPLFATMPEFEGAAAGANDGARLASMHEVFGAAIARAPGLFSTGAAEHLRMIATADSRATAVDDRKAASFGADLLAVTRAIPPISQREHVARLVETIVRPGTRYVKEMGPALEAGVGLMAETDLDDARRRLVAGLDATRDPVRHEALLRGYAAFARTAGGADDVDRLSEALKDPGSTELLASLSAALGQASTTAGPEIADRTRSDVLKTALQASIDTPHARAFAHVLVALAPAATQATSDATALALMADIHDDLNHLPDSFGRLRWYAVAAAAYADRVSDAQLPALTDALSAAALTTSLPKSATLALQWRSTGEYMGLSSLLESNIDPSGVLFLNEVNTALTAGLATVTLRQSPADATARIPGLLARASKGVQFDASGAYLSILVTRSAQPPGVEAGQLLDAIRHIDGGPATDTTYVAKSQVLALVEGLRVAVKATPADQMEALAVRIIATMKASCPQAQAPLNAQLAWVLKHAPPGHEARMANLLLQNIAGDTDAQRIRELSGNLAFLLPQVPPGQLDIESLIDALRYPSTPRQDVIDAMAQAMPGMPSADQGELAAIKFIVARSGRHIDLDAKAK